MKKIVLIIALLSVNSVWAGKGLNFRTYQRMPWKKILERVIYSHPGVDSKYITAYFEKTKKHIKKGKAHLCIIERDGQFVLQAALNPQKNGYYRQELVALGNEPIDEAKMEELTMMLKQKFPSMKGLACCFPPEHYEKFKILLEKTKYKFDLEVAEDPVVMKEKYSIDTSRYFWFSRKLEKE